MDEIGAFRTIIQELNQMDRDGELVAQNGQGLHLDTTIPPNLPEPTPRTPLKVRRDQAERKAKQLGHKLHGWEQAYHEWHNFCPKCQHMVRVHHSGRFKPTGKVMYERCTNR